jgi:arginyl-tRNA synthetase
MATLSSQGVQALLTEVGVESQIPSFEFTDIQNSPMSIYLSYVADILVQLTECTPQVAFESIQWPNELGDLVIVSPRLRLKDVDASELAVDLKKRVGYHAHSSYQRKKLV